MAARRLFAAGLALLGFSAVASAQCPTSGCGTACGSPVAVASASCPGCPTGVAVAPTGFSESYASEDTGRRRGLFGRRSARRSTSSGVMTAGYATAMPVAPAFTPAGYAEVFPATGVVAGCPMPTTGPIATVSGTAPPVPMPMPSQAVTGTVAPSNGTVPTTPLTPGTVIQPAPIAPTPMGVTYPGQPIGTEFTTSTSTSSSRRGLFSRIFRGRR